MSQLTLGATAKTRVTAADGSVLYRTLLRGLAGETCDWCDLGQRLAVYTWGRRPRSILAGDGWYCSLHCWGQRHGFTDL